MRPLQTTFRPPLLMPTLPCGPASEDQEEPDRIRPGYVNIWNTVTGALFTCAVLKNGNGAPVTVFLCGSRASPRGGSGSTGAGSRTGGGWRQARAAGREAANDARYVVSNPRAPVVREGSSPK
jgi:hypothetical protein